MKLYSRLTKVITNIYFVFLKIKHQLINKIKFYLLRMIYINVTFIYKNKFGTFYTNNGLDLYLLSLLYNNIINNNDNLIVEVGISGPNLLSKSLIFENNFKCSVININLIPHYEMVWKEERPHSIFVNYSIDTNHESHSIHIENNNIFLRELFFFNSIYTSSNNLDIVVKTKSLNNIINDLDYKEILILFLDFNFYTIETLQQINFEHLKIKCICISYGNTSLVCQLKIQSYIKKMGFSYNARFENESDVFIRKSLFHGIELTDIF